MGTSAAADEISYCTNADELQTKECRVVEVEMEMEGNASPRRDDGESQTSVITAAGGGNTVQLPFSKDLITFSLFGKMTKHSKI